MKARIKVNGHVLLFKVQVVVKDSKEDVWQIKTAIAKINDESSEFIIDGIKPRVVLDIPPWRRPYTKRGGKLMGYLEKQGITNLKPEWGPPLLIYHLPAEGRPALLAELKDGGGEWEIYDEAIATVKPGLSKEGILAAGRT